ncbi:WSC domain-containing protein [Cadophora sp. MPI-SDFR-AT-0126]|nr:WSC domain-containing protein [Leotiomycetes sp. MPI-SDFR-AT-0126]
MTSIMRQLLWGFLWIIPTFVAAGSQPNMPYDSTTTKDCTWWYDNYEGLTCDYIRNAFRISIEDFVLWNPSLTSTCGNWKERSYCVEVNDFPTSSPSIQSSTASTRSSTTSSAMATSTVKPHWTPLGCYLDSTPPTLSTRTDIVGGDSAMTIENCQTACFSSGLTYAGLEAKSQCWCGDYVANELANSTDCNMPCAGNSTQICGGVGRINVYKGVIPSSSTSSSTISTSTSASSASAPTSTSPVSFDGLCGPSSPKSATCAGSAFGNCCSNAGQCGWNSSFCAPAVCQNSFGTCDVGPPVNLDGKCGAAAACAGIAPTSSVNATLSGAIVVLHLTIAVLRMGARTRSVLSLM